MILPDLDLKPVLIPHHKGRKRLHLGTAPLIDEFPPPGLDCGFGHDWMLIQQH